MTFAKMPKLDGKTLSRRTSTFLEMFLLFCFFFYLAVKLDGVVGLFQVPLIHLYKYVHSTVLVK